MGGVSSGDTDLDLVEIGAMFGRLTDNHTRRMQSLGLAA